MGNAKLIKAAKLPATGNSPVLKVSKASKTPSRSLVAELPATGDSPLSGVSKALKTPSRSLVAELASHEGYASIALDNYGRDGLSRRSTRVSKPTTKAFADTYVDPPGKPRRVAELPSPAKAQKTPIKKATPRLRLRFSPTDDEMAHRAAEILCGIAAKSDDISAAETLCGMAEKSDVTSATGTLSPATLSRSATTSPTPSADILAAMALYNLSHVCTTPPSLCTSCPTLTVDSNNLIMPACGGFSWYVGSIGMFEIGDRPWPQIRKSITYIHSEEYRTTALPSSRQTTPVSMGDTELDVQMAQEEDEWQMQREEVARRFSEAQVEEWMAFCKFGNKKAWGLSLNPYQRPAHIGNEKWDTYWNDINEKHDAKMAAMRMQYRS